MNPTFNQLEALNARDANLFDGQVMKVYEHPWLDSARARAEELGHKPDDFFLYHHQGTGAHVFAMWVTKPEHCIFGKGEIKALFSLPWGPGETKWMGHECPPWPAGEVVKRRLAPAHKAIMEMKAEVQAEHHKRLEDELYQGQMREKLAGDLKREDPEMSKRITRGEIPLLFER